MALRKIMTVISFFVKDELTSMKAWLSKWILRGTTIKNTFSPNTSKLQQLQEQTHRDAIKNQIAEVVAERGAKSKITKDTLSLQEYNLIQSDAKDEHQSEEIKEQEYMHSKNKQRQQYNVFAVDIKEKQHLPVVLRLNVKLAE